MNETWYSGLVTIDHSKLEGFNDTNVDDIFYWWFESRGNASDPVVLWLTGGPGCASEIALFNENGPYKFGNGSSSLS